MIAFDIVSAKKFGPTLTLDVASGLFPQLRVICHLLYVPHKAAKYATTIVSVEQSQSHGLVGPPVPMRSLGSGRDFSCTVPKSSICGCWALIKEANRRTSRLTRLTSAVAEAGICSENSALSLSTRRPAATSRLE